MTEKRKKYVVHEIITGGNGKDRGKRRSGENYDRRIGRLVYADNIENMIGEDGYLFSADGTNKLLRLTTIENVCSIDDLLVIETRNSIYCLYDIETYTLNHDAVRLTDEQLIVISKESKKKRVAQ